MKPTLEMLSLQVKQQSFNVFTLNGSRFKPFWHYHPELELTLITKGEGTRFIGDNISPFDANDLVLVGENLPHQWVSINHEPNTKVGAIVIQFPKDIFDNFPECNALKSFLENASKGFQFIKPPKHLIEQLMDFTKLSEVLKLSSFISILYELSRDNQIKQLSTKAYNLEGIDQKNKISKCVSYILEHTHERLTVKHMASQFNLAEPSFCRWFKQSVGLSFITYLNRTRIESACHYLSTTDLQIQQIAFSIGFESLSQFNRTFKKFKNMTPNTFRKTILI